MFYHSIDVVCASFKFFYTERLYAVYVFEDDRNVHIGYEN